VFSKQRHLIIAFVIFLLALNIVQLWSNQTIIITKTAVTVTPPLIPIIYKQGTLFYQRQSCSCTRPLYTSNSNLLTLNEISSSLCSHYSTLRGSHQRIISISMYGPKENAIFALNASLNFLYELINDMKKIYPDWILRVYHDATIKDDIICPIECAHNHVDFCNASALGNLGNIANYVPPKIWRFLPAGDGLVDIMGSRDLDSPLTQRELDAVNEWISSNKEWHSMRDHPWHVVPMLGKIIFLFIK
jgi:hypothetical protein